MGGQAGSYFVELARTGRDNDVDLHYLRATEPGWAALWKRPDQCGVGHPWPIFAVRGQVQPASGPTPMREVVNAIGYVLRGGIA